MCERKIRPLVRALLGTLALIGGVLGLSGTAPAAESVTRPPVVELARWHPVVPKTPFAPKKGPIVKGHTVGIFIEGGYCLNGPKPEFDHVTLVELPKTKARPFNAAIITAYRVWPEETYTPPSVTGPNYGGKCVRMERTILHRVKTKRPAKTLHLYDGYFHALHQVWPPIAR